MAKYECKVCGYIYNEQHASRSFEELSECPICNEGKENFVALDADNNPMEDVKEEVKAEVKKETAKKAPAKKAATTAKKAPAKKAEVKATVSLQFDGKEYKTEDFVKIAKDVWQYDLGKKVADFKTVELYVKPEESAVYYVINGEVTGSFAI